MVDSSRCVNVCNNCVISFGYKKSKQNALNVIRTWDIKGGHFVQIVVGGRQTLRGETDRLNIGNARAPEQELFYTEIK